MNLINPRPIDPNIRFHEEFEKAYDHVLYTFHNDSRNENEDVLVHRMYRFLYRFEKSISTNRNFINWISSDDTGAILRILKSWLSETQRKIYPINHIHILNNDVDSLFIARQGLQLAMILLQSSEEGSFAQTLALRYIKEFADLDNVILPIKIKITMEGMQ